MSWLRRKRCGDVTTRAAEAKKLSEEIADAREKKLVEAVYEDDVSERVQAAMLGEEHEPVLEPAKQDAAPMFILGPKKAPP